jgi:hypothetical protein
MTVQDRGLPHCVGPVDQIGEMFESGPSRLRVRDRFDVYRSVAPVHDNVRFPEVHNRLYAIALAVEDRRASGFRRARQLNPHLWDRHILRVAQRGLQQYNRGCYRSASVHVAPHELRTVRYIPCLGLQLS